MAISQRVQIDERSGSRQVQAYETDLTLGGLTAPGVVVEFGKPWRLTFWSAAQYAACWDLGSDVWFSPEWLETNSPEDLHCYEPIMDKACRYTRAQILTSGPARAQVKWSYALNDIRYRIFRGNTTADEVFTVYPDGIAVRKLTAWPGDASDHGLNPNFWQVMEYILINGKGTRPEETIRHDRAFTFGDGRGSEIGVSWPLPAERHSLCELYPQIGDWDRFVGRLHLQGRPDPFCAFAKAGSLFPHQPCPNCGKGHPWFGLFSHGSTFTHWPGNFDEDQILAVAAAPEEIGRVTTHTSFIDCNAFSVAGTQPPRGASWLFLTGVVEGADAGLGGDLPRLMDSWLQPARIRTGWEREGTTRIEGMAQGDWLYEGYAYSARAYTFRLVRGDSVRFRFEPQVPVVHPVFSVAGWKAPQVQVFLDGQLLPPSRFQWQVDDDELVVWLDTTLEAAVECEIRS